MLTFQDFTEAVSKGRLLKFIRDAIEQHRNSDVFKIAEIADQYDLQRNTTISNFVKKFYNLNGIALNDFTSSNNKIASNFFKRLNTQRCTYSLGNGIEFDEKGIKDRLGDDFDTRLFTLAYNSLKHGVSFGFWNVDQLHIFPLTEFVPLFDEDTGGLRAGIRYWSIDWMQKPIFAVLYEEDGFTKFRSKGKTGLALEETEPKRAYRQTIAYTEVSGDEVIGEENYNGLPIIPLWGNKGHQSTLVGMRAAIDSYDLIQSGYANDMTDCAEIYWIVENALGMEDDDLQKFLDRLKLSHIATIDADNSGVKPYTQEPPYNAREAFLNRIQTTIYRDYGALNPEVISAGNITATQIRAAYQSMDEEADDFEYQIIDFVRRLLKLMDIDAMPIFKRNRIVNEAEMVNMVISEANYLDDETILKKLPNITTDEVDSILAAKYEQDKKRKEPADFEDNEEDEDTKEV